MKKTRTAAVLTLAAVACFLLGPTGAAAAAPAAAKTGKAARTPAKPKISPDQVLQKFVEATGGRAAYDRLKTTVMKGTIEIAAQGI